MKFYIKSLLPKTVYELLLKRQERQKEKLFFKQGFTHIKCGVYKIIAPDAHPLINLIKTQPYRDLCVGISAKYIAKKYPKETIVDIGANIGDTAAMIATYCSNKLILVEASDYFFDILSQNISQFPNECVVEKVLISDGNLVSGTFHHWGGTASFLERKDGQMQMETKQLSDVADETTCFIKTDTDGYDFKILIEGLDWLNTVHPAILFENQIRSSQDLNSANDLYQHLMQIGYEYFILWDDPGFHLLSTTSIDDLTGLNLYMFKVWECDGPKSICNYDVLCLHKNDKDIYDDISAWYKNY
jgi:FkbM family methyltransferase